MQAASGFDAFALPLERLTVEMAGTAVLGAVSFGLAASGIFITFLPVSGALERTLCLLHLYFGPLQKMQLQGAAVVSSLWDAFVMDDTLHVYQHQDYWPRDMRL